MKFQYHRPLPIPRDQAEAAFQSGEPHRIREALIRCAFHEEDYSWVEGRCLEYLRHPDPTIRQVAATSLGHLGRIHGTLDAARVIPALQALLVDSEVAGSAQDALDDIRRFVGQ